jgi:hypothetical protein
MKTYGTMLIRLDVFLMALDVGQAHILAILTLGKYALLPTREETGCDPDMVWICCKIKVPAHVMD